MCSAATAPSLGKISAGDWIRPEIPIHVQWISFPGRWRCRNEEILWVSVCSKLQTYIWPYTMTGFKELYILSVGWVPHYFNQELNNSVAWIILPATIRLRERSFPFNIHNSPAAGCFLTQGIHPFHIDMAVTPVQWSINPFLAQWAMQEGICEHTEQESMPQAAKQLPLRALKWLNTCLFIREHCRGVSAAQFFSMPYRVKDATRL